MYYCKNCGEPYMTGDVVMCIKCGTAKGQGRNFCYNCGKPLTSGGVVCSNCGIANKQSPAPGAKSKIAAGLLGIFLGVFGVHNFYLGYTVKAVIQLVLSVSAILICCCTFFIGAIFSVMIIVGVWVWSLVEAIMILAGRIDTDAEGNSLAD